MRRRDFRNLLIGLVFGVGDWYYVALLSQYRLQALLLGNETIVWLARLLIVALNYGIWLVLALPIAIYEVGQTRSARSAARAAAVTWCAAILSYYVYYAVLFTLVGLPGLEFLQLGNHESPAYWTVWMNHLRSLILAQYAEWTVVAITGGVVVGSGTAWLARRRQHAPSRPASASGFSE